MKENECWDFKKIYPDFETFEDDVKKLEKDMVELAKMQGGIKDKSSLLDYLDKSTKGEILLSKIYCYAHMRYDLDQKSSEGQVLFGRASNLYSTYLQSTSFASAEILALGEKVLLEFAQKPEFKDYDYLLKSLIHQQSHIKSSNEEKILANFFPVTNNFSNLFDMLAVADNKDIEVTFSTGESAVINHANYHSYLASLKSQDDRRIAFEAIFKTCYDHRNTYASIYNGLIQSNIAEMRNRGYDSLLASYLEHNAIPDSVYLSLIESAHKNSNIVKEYYQIKKNYLKLDTFHTYDRAFELARSEKKYTYEEAKDLFFKSIEELGSDFIEKAKNVLAPGKVDVYHKEGKRTGAYSTGYYDLGPYILLNFDGTLSDVFTLAHEAGHSIHTMLANENNSYLKSNYTIFVAEIASTFNEQVLLDHLMNQPLDHQTKIFLLQTACDGLIGTFFRQTLFAEYEYLAHELALKNESINANSLENLMTKLYQEYYGIDLDKEPYKNDVWAYIPHLYHSPFYVYQYATCFACSLAIYADVKDKKEGAIERYFDMLKAGGSNFPMDIVKIGGVDLTTSAPFDAVAKRLSYLIGELKKELQA